MQTISVEEAVAKIDDGASLLIGGFMAVGTPERVIDEIVRLSFQSEKGLAGPGAIPAEGVAHPMLTDAGGRPGDGPAVIVLPNGAATLIETGPGISVAEEIAANEAELVVPTNVPGMQL